MKTNMWQKLKSYRYLGAGVWLGLLCIAAIGPVINKNLFFVYYNDTIAVALNANTVPEDFQALVGLNGVAAVDRATQTVRIQERSREQVDNDLIHIGLETGEFTLTEEKTYPPEFLISTASAAIVAALLSWLLVTWFLGARAVRIVIGGTETFYILSSLLLTNVSLVVIWGGALSYLSRVAILAEGHLISMAFALSFLLMLSSVTFWQLAARRDLTKDNWLQVWRELTHSDFALVRPILVLAAILFVGLSVVMTPNYLLLALTWLAALATATAHWYYLPSIIASLPRKRGLSFSWRLPGWFRRSKKKK